jgi:hypothetical protein
VSRVWTDHFSGVQRKDSAHQSWRSYTSPSHCPSRSNLFIRAANSYRSIPVTAGRWRERDQRQNSRREQTRASDCWERDSEARLRNSQDQTVRATIVGSKSGRPMQMCDRTSQNHRGYYHAMMCSGDLPQFYMMNISIQIRVKSLQRMEMMGTPIASCSFRQRAGRLDQRSNTNQARVRHLNTTERRLDARYVEDMSW